MVAIMIYCFPLAGMLGHNAYSDVRSSVIID